MGVVIFACCKNIIEKSDKMLRRKVAKDQLHETIHCGGTVEFSLGATAHFPMSRRSGESVELAMRLCDGDLMKSGHEIHLREDLAFDSVKRVGYMRHGETYFFTLGIKLA